jgi:hypothetical protein
MGNWALVDENGVAVNAERFPTAADAHASANDNRGPRRFGTGSEGVKATQDPKFDPAQHPMAGAAPQTAVYKAEQATKVAKEVSRFLSAVSC